MKKITRRSPSGSRKSRALRIGLVGCAGTNKTAVAKEVASRLGVEFIDSSSVTKEILRRDGYDYTSGVQVERFLADSSRQKEILKRTMDRHLACESFVIDRTLIDLAAYAVVELHDEDLSLLRTIFHACRERVGLYTHLFLIPWKDVPVRNNRRRTINPWYQFLIHAVDEGIMTDWGVKSFSLTADGVDGRAEEIIRIVKRRR
jgi:hypothetical protein